jgi:hypothetical protein
MGPRPGCLIAETIDEPHQQVPRLSTRFAGHARAVSACACGGEAATAPPSAAP